MKLVFLSLTALLFTVISKLGPAARPHKHPHAISALAAAADTNESLKKAGL